MPSATRSTLASALALGVTDQALALALLTFGQDVLLVGVRILALAEFQPQRRADELEALAQEVLEVALVAVRQALHPRAVDHDGGRVLAGRVREAQLGRVAAHDRRSVGLVGDLDRARQLGGGELARGRL